MTKKIALTQGKFALVDDRDWEWLSQWKWYAMKHGNTWYAARKESGVFRKTVLMHRAIAGPSNDKETDHQDGNGLNNVRSNLRVCSKAENLRNQRLPRNNSSGFKGVSWKQKNQKWVANISSDGKKIHLGYFESPKEAALAYDFAARKMFGDFARTNFKDKDM